MSEEREGTEMRTIRFGFENLEVWQKSVDFANTVISFAEEIKTDRKHYRLIEQLEGAYPFPLKAILGNYEQTWAGWGKGKIGC